MCTFLLTACPGCAKERPDRTVCRRIFCADAAIHQEDLLKRKDVLTYKKELASDPKRTSSMRADIIEIIMFKLHKLCAINMRYKEAPGRLKHELQHYRDLAKANTVDMAGIAEYEDLPGLDLIEYDDPKLYKANLDWQRKRWITLWQIGVMITVGPCVETFLAQVPGGQEKWRTHVFLQGEAFKFSKVHTDGQPLPSVKDTTPWTSLIAHGRNINILRLRGNGGVVKLGQRQSFSSKRIPQQPLPEAPPLQPKGTYSPQSFNNETQGHNCRQNICNMSAGGDQHMLPQLSEHNHLQFQQQSMTRNQDGSDGFDGNNDPESEYTLEELSTF